MLGAELFVSRISRCWAPSRASCCSAFGKEHLRILGFPIAFLFLMIPLPAIVFNQIAFPLQLLALAFRRDGPAGPAHTCTPGNVIMANTRLEVAEACSGIRSLISLLTLRITLGYFTDSEMADAQ